MLLNIVGWLWIIFGVLFLAWPQLLQKRLRKKGFKTVKKALFLMTFLLAGGLVSVAFKIKGIISIILMVIGIIGILKAFFLLKSKAAEKLMEWFLKQPLILFRAGGIIYIIVGLIILIFLK